MENAILIIKMAVGERIKIPYDILRLLVEFWHSKYYYELISEYKFAYERRKYNVFISEKIIIVPTDFVKLDWDFIFSNFHSCTMMMNYHKPISIKINISIYHYASRVSYSCVICNKNINIYTNRIFMHLNDIVYNIRNSAGHIITVIEIY